MEDYLSVFISDGNRLTNYDCKPGRTLAEVLSQRGYGWIRGTLKVNGVRIRNDDVHETLEQLQHDTLIGKPYTYRMKVLCQTPLNDPTKKPEKPVRKKERETADVR